MQARAKCQVLMLIPLMLLPMGARYPSNDSFSIEISVIVTAELAFP